MNRTLRYALVAAMGATLALPALGQDNFPDVPDNHWAYEALKNMKAEGLLVGYPDGLFRGGRPASRYELAVAIHATYQRLKGITDGLDAQIKALTSSLDGKADKADLQSLRDALAALQNDVNGMKGWGDDIANLKKLASTFEKEIASLGVDVEAMKKDLADLKDRVDKLEKRKPAVDIHGTVDLVALAGYSTSDRFGITVDGRPTGFGRGDYYGDPSGVTRDLTLFHEGALTFSGTNEEGPKWKATLVVGNMLGGSDDRRLDLENPGFGDQSNIAFGSPFMETDQTVYFQDFVVSFDTSLLGQNFSAEIGRTGYKVSPYIFQRQDTTPYFANERWDNGKWMFDGAILGFNFGPAKLVAFGGRKSDRVASGENSVELQPMTVGPFASMPIDQMMGLHLSAPITDKAEINLAYLWLDSNQVFNYTSTDLYNRLAVYGGDIKLNFAPFTLEGGYSATIVQYNQHNVYDDLNTAWYGKLGYKADKWGLHAGYREIEEDFAAPGDWGRIGTWWNPTDIKGFCVGGNITLSDNLSLKAAGEFYKQISNEDYKYNRYTADLGYKINANWDLNLGWEYVSFDNSDDDVTPYQTWYNIGLNYGLSDKSKLSILWQISDMDQKGLYGFSGPERATGGLITTQLSVKF